MKGAGIMALYRRLWGDPSAKYRFTHPADGIPDPIHVHVFELPEPVWVYATEGVGRLSQPHPPPGTTARMEMFLLASAPNEELVRSLGSIAIYPFVFDTWLGEGHTIRGGDHSGMVGGSPLSDVLIARGEFDGIDDVVFDASGQHVHLLWVIPVHRCERQYALDHGWRALLDAFEEHDTDVADLARPPVVPAVTGS